MRCADDAAIADGQTAEAEHGHLPRAAEVGEMQPADGVELAVCDVQIRAAGEIVIGLLLHAQPRRQPAVGRVAQRAVVRGARLVIPIGVLLFLHGKTFRQQAHQRHGVGLLRHLIERQRLVGEGGVDDALGRRLGTGEVERPAQPVGAVLPYQLPLLVIRDPQPIRDGREPGDLFLGQSDLFAQGGIPLRRGVAQNAQQPRGGA